MVTADYGDESGADARARPVRPQDRGVERDHRRVQQLHRPAPDCKGTISRLRGGVFLFDAQEHTANGLDNPTAQVERGQLLVMKIADWRTVYGS